MASSPRTRAHIVAYRFRWALLSLAVLCESGTVVWWFWINNGTSQWPGMLLVVGVFLLLQALFLSPRRGWTVKLSSKGRPMILSLLIASAVVAMLTFGLVAALLELASLWEPLHGWLDPWKFWSGMAVIWAFWAVMFFFNGRRTDHYTWLTRMIRRILAGSVVELLVAAPVNAFVKDTGHCECARGSFWALVIGIPALLWTFGPGIVLLFMQKRYLAMKALPLCANCGYDLRGSPPGGDCPECGTATTATPHP